MCHYDREKKVMMLKHHGIWWIILLLYTHLVHTSMSILNCPFLTLTNSSKPVSYSRFISMYGEREREREREVLIRMLYQVTFVIVEMVYRWKYWLLDWMAHTTCSAGHYGANSDYSPHPIGLPHFIETTHNQSKLGH